VLAASAVELLLLLLLLMMMMMTECQVSTLPPGGRIAKQITSLVLFYVARQSTGPTEADGSSSSRRKGKINAGSNVLAK